jgi:hypothetical protein
MVTIWRKLRRQQDLRVRAILLTAPAAATAVEPAHGFGPTREGVVVIIQNFPPCITTNSSNSLLPEVEAGTAAGTAAVSTAATAAVAVAPVAGGAVAVAPVAGGGGGGTKTAPVNTVAH